VSFTRVRQFQSHFWHLFADRPLFLLPLPTAADPNAAEAPAGDHSSAEKPIEATDEPGSGASLEETAPGDDDTEANADVDAPIDDAAQPTDGGAEPSGVPAGEESGTIPDGEETDVPEPAVKATPATPLPQCTLHEAAEVGDIDVMRLLLSVANSDVDVRDDMEATPLVVAAAASQRDAAKVLITHGADPNAQNAKGDTALHWACYRGCLETVKKLLQAGAAVNARGDVGNTPLHMACTEHHEQIALELLSRGADVFVRNDVQITPLGVTTKETLRVTVREVEKGGDKARATIRKTLAAEAAALAERERVAAEQVERELNEAKMAVEATEAKRAADDETQRQLELKEAQEEAAAVKAELGEIRAAEAEAARKAEEERLRLEAEKAAKKAAKKKGKGKGKKK